MNLTHTLQSICNLLTATWKNRNVYQTWADVYRSLTLRAAIGNLGGRIFQPRLIRLAVRGCGTPVYLRRKTSDFQIFMGLFEEQTYDVVSRLPVGSAPFIIDCGGNVGLATLRFSLLQPGARFVVVEPDADNGQVLRRNLAHLIGSGRCRVVEGFVSDSDGQATIDRSGAASEFRMVPARTTDAKIIPVYGMPTLIAQSEVDAIDLLKVDIEGAEQMLFERCGPWIGRIRNMIVEVDPPFTIDGLVAELERNGAKPTVVHRHASEVAIRLD